MRRRLALAIAGVAAASVALFAFPLGLALQHTYRDDEHTRLQRDTVAATRQIDIGGRPDQIELPSGGDQLGVYDLHGRRIAGSGPARADDLVSDSLRTGRPTDRDRGGQLLTAVPLLLHERVAGAVRASRSDAQAVARTHRAWLRLLALAAVVMALALAAAWALGRRLATPLERLAVAARRLGDGEFGAQAPRSGEGELDMVGRALDATAARLADLIGRERSFSADASHQLRTPLAALRLELEALELREGSSPELASALAEADRLEATIGTLLAVARDAPIERSEMPLDGLLTDVEDAWRPLLARRSRPLHVRHDPGLAVIASPTVLRQIIDVLVDNACEHGAGPVGVVARSVADGSFVAMEVTDEGPGVDDAASVFGRRRSASGSGHGIGLALARSLAHAEGGRLDLNGPGPHPTFTLLIPAATQGSRSLQEPGVGSVE